MTFEVHQVVGLSDSFFRLFVRFSSHTHVSGSQWQNAFGRSE
jgi:hypothetical protein